MGWRHETSANSSLCRQEFLGEFFVQLACEAGENRRSVRATTVPPVFPVQEQIIYLLHTIKRKQLIMQINSLLLAFTVEGAVAKNGGWRFPPFSPHGPHPTHTPPRPTLPTIPITPQPIPISQCTTGGAQCCNSLQRADSPQVAGLLNLLGAVNVPDTTQVGVTCKYRYLIFMELCWRIS